MVAPKIDDAVFIRLFEEKGPHETARQANVDIRNVFSRRANLEKKLGRQITAPEKNRAGRTRGVRTGVQHPGRVEYELKNGVALIGSDLHIWPGPAPVMHRAFVKFCKDVEPGMVILNGDVVDMAAVSRHPPIGWEKQPTVQEEIETAQDRLSEIEQAVGRCPKVWTLGNHDGRFETRLATVAPEYAKLKGVHLNDHFPAWESAWSCWINDDVVVKHSSKVVPFTDYRGTRFGVDSGCMADTDHGAFLDYTEDNPKNWRSAFALLTFKDGALLYPELVQKWDETHVQFRGEIIEV